MNVLPCLMFVLAPAIQDAEPQGSDWFQVGPETVTIRVVSQPAPSLFDLLRACEPIVPARFYMPDRSDADALEKELLSMTQPVVVRHEALYGYFQGLLKAHNFACAPVTREPDLLVRIVRLQGEGLQFLKNNIRYVAPDEVDEYREQHATLISTMIPLQRIDPQALNQTLARFFTSSAVEGFSSFGHAQGDTRGVMLVGFGPTVANLAQMIREMDSQETAKTASDHVSLEVWFVPAGPSSAQVEALLENGDVKEALAAMRRSLDAGAQRLGRFRGQAVDQIGIDISASVRGGEQGLGAELSLMPRYNADGSLQIEVGLEVQGASDGGSFQSRIRGGALLNDGAHDALSSSSSKGIVVLFMHRS